VISPGYLQTVKTPLVAGRDFTWHDDGNSPRVAIVNQTFARKLYGDTPAIRQRFALWATAKYEVVGVVEDGKYNSIGEDPEPMMLIPLAQGIGEVKSTFTTVIVRSPLPEDQITAALHRTLTNVEPASRLRCSHGRIGSIFPWSRACRGGCSRHHGHAGRDAGGDRHLRHGSYSVSKRMREQGIRMALGAQRVQVLRSTLARPVLLLLFGSGIGLVAGVMMSRLLAHLISFATPREPLILAGVLCAMVLLGLLATFIPARRALAIDPARLLRES